MAGLVADARILTYGESYAAFRYHSITVPPG